MLKVGQEVLVLASRLKKKDSSGNSYKSSVDNKSYFHKSEIFLIRNRQKIDEKNFLLKSSRSCKIFLFSFQREEIFAILNSFN